MKTKRTILTLSALLLAPLGTLQAADVQPSKPNLVVILVDDMGYGDIAPFGSKKNRTPNLDKMASEGMKLTSFYCAQVCTASRAQLMTGCYAARVSLTGALMPVNAKGINAKEHTVAELLKQQGYATMMVGKWHLGDQEEFLPTRHGFDHYFGLPYSNDMTFLKKGNPPLPLLRDAKVIEAPAEQDTLTARYTDEALKFITANAPTGSAQAKPFFLYYAHTAVHVPLHPGAAFKGKSANGTYGDWVEEVDWSVGCVLAKLKELKLDKNTLVLFTSDNGPWLEYGKAAGSALPLRGGKHTTWEGGMREPAIVRWPGQIAPGSVCDTVLSETDVLPTFVKLAGGKVPADNKIDGKDMWPVLSGKTKESPREALFYFSQGRKIEAVRSGPWKLAVEPQALPKIKGVREEVPHTGPRLYNLDTDIGETTDVAAQNPGVVAKLLQLIEKMKNGEMSDKAQWPRLAGNAANPQPLLKKIGSEYD
ncbi:MAG: sulfatase [bacterium]